MTQLTILIHCIRMAGMVNDNCDVFISVNNCYVNVHNWNFLSEIHEPIISVNCIFHSLIV